MYSISLKHILTLYLKEPSLKFIYVVNVILQIPRHSKINLCVHTSALVTGNWIVELFFKGLCYWIWAFLFGLMLKALAFNPSSSSWMSFRNSWSMYSFVIQLVSLYSQICHMYFYLLSFCYYRSPLDVFLYFLLTIQFFFFVAPNPSGTVQISSFL